MLPNSFEEILKGPTFVINLDRCIDRWDILKQRIEDAGFKPTRFSGIDGREGMMKEKWIQFGVRSDVDYKFASDGQSGCTISNAKVWQHIVDNNIPFANIFEDDVRFHKDWTNLAPIFYEKTDKSTDILYYGSQGSGIPSHPIVTSVPVFCTHAYLITLDGAKKLVEQFRIATSIFVIDCFLITLMHNNPPPFKWQCWNGSAYDDPAKNTSLHCRNNGLVYQDDTFETNIHCHSPPELKDYLN